MSELDESAENARQENAARGGGRLVRRTFIIALVLLSSGFIAGGVIELWLRYQESVHSIWTLSGGDG